MHTPTLWPNTDDAHLRILVTAASLLLGVVTLAGCAAEQTADPPGVPATAATADPSYSAMNEPIAGPPPLFSADMPAPERLKGATSYRVGDSDRYPAYLVRLATGELCVYARGDDGIGGACGWAGKPSDGVLGLGEVRADGSYALSLVVPDEVSAVTLDGKRTQAIRNLVVVRPSERGGTAQLESSRGAFTIEIPPSRLPERFRTN